MLDVELTVEVDVGVVEVEEEVLVELEEVVEEEVEELDEVVDDEVEELVVEVLELVLLLVDVLVSEREVDVVDEELKVSNMI